MAPKQTSITAQDSSKNGCPKITKDPSPSFMSITKKSAIYYKEGKWINTSLTILKDFLLDPSPRVIIQGRGYSFPYSRSFAK